MGEIRLIASDIDGTLLPAGAERIPDRALRALAAASARGILVVPASGRLISAIPPELLEVPGIRYVITCNGASVMDLQTGESIYDKRIPAELAADLLRKLKNYDVYSCVYLPDGPHNWSSLHPGLMIHYSNRIPFFSIDPHDDLADYVEERGIPAEKIFVAVFSVEERDRLRRELGNLHGIYVTSSSAWNLEINHVEADKGSALAWLSRRLDIPPEEILAMGDNENDFSMLSFAGTAVVPANGTPVIRRIATAVVADCALCGTAAYLEKAVLKADAPGGE